MERGFPLHLLSNALPEPPENSVLGVKRNLGNRTACGMERRKEREMLHVSQLRKMKSFYSGAVKKLNRKPVGPLLMNSSL